MKSTTPGSVSTSRSRIVSFCFCAKLRLRLRELDVVEIALAQLGYRAVDLGRGKLERGRRPVVELLRELAHRCIAPRLDLGEDLFPPSCAPWRRRL
jgi:hypothetical protein